MALNETLSEGGDITDGISITRRMWDRDFIGITGHVRIDDNGDRDADYSILDLDPITGRSASIKPTISLSPFARVNQPPFCQSTEYIRSKRHCGTFEFTLNSTQNFDEAYARAVYYWYYVADPREKNTRIRNLQVRSDRALFRIKSRIQSCDWKENSLAWRKRRPSCRYSRMWISGKRSCLHIQDWSVYFCRVHQLGSCCVSPCCCYCNLCVVQASILFVIWIIM